MSENSKKKKKFKNVTSMTLFSPTLLRKLHQQFLSQQNFALKAKKSFKQVGVKF